MIKAYFLLSSFLILGLGLFAQTSTMWLMNGKKVIIQEYTLIDDDFEGGIVQYTNANGKQKTKDTQDVFSVFSGEQEVQVFYKKDLDMGNEFTIDEMRKFLNGKTDIKKIYKGGWFTVGGILAGIAGGGIPPAKIEGSGGGTATIPWAPVIPVAYVIIAGNTTKTFDQLEKDYPELNKDEHYKMGCQKGIQEKRLKNSIIGAVIGIAAGAITLSAIQ